MKRAVLLLAHGAPERLEDIPQYLTNIRGGRPMAPDVVEEVRRRYREIGGGSPLLVRTRDQAEALQGELDRAGCGARVYVAMRNWHPFIRETMERMEADGVEKIVALCLAPQYSKMSVGLYFRRVQEARQAIGMKADVVWTKTFHDHPALIEGFAEKLRPLLPSERVLFTAHSLPVGQARSPVGPPVPQAPPPPAPVDPYEGEARATARSVAQRCGLTHWDFAFQSQGLTGDDWLGPTVESVLDRYASEGVRHCVLAPIGFVSDHVEILYDVDILFRGFARDRGIELVRTGSLNASPGLVKALAGVAMERL